MLRLTCASAAWSASSLSARAASVVTSIVIGGTLECGSRTPCTQVRGLCERNTACFTRCAPREKQPCCVPDRVESRGRGPGSSPIETGLQAVRPASPPLRRLRALLMPLKFVAGATSSGGAGARTAEAVAVRELRQQQASTAAAIPLAAFKRAAPRGDGRLHLRPRAVARRGRGRAGAPRSTSSRSSTPRSLRRTASGRGPYEHEGRRVALQHRRRVRGVQRGENSAHAERA